MLVIDASLAVELSLDRLGEHADRAFGEEQLVAPPLLWSEVTSALSEMAFRCEISEGLASHALERFLGRQINIAERRPDGLAKTAWEIARELGWAKTYDAEYLATARLLDTRVVTLDVRLRRGANRLGLVVTPAELISDTSPNPETGPSTAPE